MYKIILLFVLLMSSTLLFANGRGVNIELNNYLNNDISIEIKNSQCVSGLNNIPEHRLSVKTKFYLEATNGLFDGCLFKPAWIKFNLNKQSNNNLEILSQYNLKISAVNGSQILYENKTNKIELITQVYSSTKVTGDQDKVIITLSPKLDHWMHDTAKKLAEKNLNQISFPGSHDSGSYLISSSSDFSPDVNSSFRKLGEIAKPILANWSKTQNDNIFTQLYHGIRYFDLRICGNPESIYTCHQMRSASLKQITKQIKQFLLQTDHQKEIILLDLNHWYPETSENYQNLQKQTLSYLQQNLGPWIAERSKFNPSSKLIDFWQQNKQVIILSTENPDTSLYPFVWQSVNTTNINDCNNESTDLCSLWPDQVNLPGLINKVESNIKEFNNSKYKYLRLLQLQATPDSNTIIKAIINASQNPSDLMQFTKKYKTEITEFINNNTSSKIGLYYIEDFSNGLELTQIAIKKNSSGQED